MTELQGHEDRLEISADSGVFVRSRAEGLHSRSRVGGSAPALCQRARCYQSRPWDLAPFRPHGLIDEFRGHDTVLVARGGSIRAALAGIVATAGRTRARASGGERLRSSR